MPKARADPHMKCRMPYGKDPSDGETAKDLEPVGAFVPGPRG